jgi:hypothetical protein
MDGNALEVDDRAKPNGSMTMCFSQPYLICDPDDGNLPKQLETYP